MPPASRSTTRALATSTRSSRPASPRASCPMSPACPARARSSTSPTRASSSRSRTPSTSRPTRPTPPALAALQVNGKHIGVFIKALVKGLIWYNPKLYDCGGAAGDLGRPPDDGHRRATRARPTPRRGASGSSPAPRSRLAGHRLDRGPRPPPGRPGRLRQLGGGQDQVDLTRDQERLPDVRRRRQRTPTAAPTPSIDRRTSATAATRCSRRRPAASSTTRRASSPASSASSRPTPRPGPTTTSSRSRTSTRSSRGAVDGAGDLFGMFNDTPQAKALMKYLVTPQAQDIWVKLGGAHLRQQERRRRYPDDITKRSADAPDERQDLPRSTPRT